MTVVEHSSKGRQGGVTFASLRKFLSFVLSPRDFSTNILSYYPNVVTETNLYIIGNLKLHIFPVYILYKCTMSLLTTLLTCHLRNTTFSSIQINNIIATAYNANRDSLMRHNKINIVTYILAFTNST